MRAIIAAITLAAVTLGVTLGTIWTAGEAKAYCPPQGPCPAPEISAMDRTADDFEASAQDFLFQLEQGFLHMAGMPPTF